MRLLGRYVFREILTSSLLGTLLATFIIFLHGADALFKVLVGSSPPAATVAKLLALAMPPVLPFTIPFGVLIGILIGLGRMSSDGEIVAMRAAGVSSRKVIAPVLLFAALGMAIGSGLQDMQGFQLIMNFLVMPIYFLSGALFPLTGLPVALSYVTKADPLTYGIDGMRSALLGQSAFDPRLDFAVLAVVGCLLLALGAYRFKKIEV